MYYKIDNTKGDFGNENEDEGYIFNRFFISEDCGHRNPLDGQPAYIYLVRSNPHHLVEFRRGDFFTLIVAFFLNVG